MLGVSVIIPTLNRAPLVSRAVESALSALSDEDELIVVDDGSTDGTSEALARYEGQIHVLRGRGAGVGAARNAGMREATRDLLAFLDDDDEWMEDKIDLQRK